ncbi:MAG: tyrosine-type recombinase/integrase [Pseudomonadota bacterium]
MAYQQSIDWQIFDEAGRRKYVSEDERARFLEAANHEPPKIKALCYLLAYTGCRVSEALSLKRFHIDPERRVITFQTLKRRKLVFRCVPVPRAITEMLLAVKASGEANLWTIHRSTAWRWIKRVMRAANITGPMATCKGLRHGFGIWAATRSVPPNLIQR